PLMLVAISSPANIQRLEEIRQDHQRLADTTSLSDSERDRLVPRTPLVVWLAYGVHGNESSSAEAAMAAAYLLAAGQGDGTGSIARMLENMVVLIDPLSNPDGRERYVSGFEQRRGAEPNPNRSAAEHWEPWPGGRQNHYLIDLNRDWAWASQQETRHRIAAYRSWEPQVYVDFHEMGSESSYFFPPAAEPIHPQIDRRVVSWLETFGRGNAEVFDKLGWVYFKEENYDLFYPGYGDSYPSLRGAVGMTYEMAGGGRGGLSLALPDGTLLTLADRVARHLTTSLTTLRTASANGRRLLEDYVANRIKAASEPRAYLWSGEQAESRALADLLVLHGIRVHQTTQVTDLAATSLTDDGRFEDGELGGASVKRFPAGTYVVSTTQPLGNLVEALLERESPMSERFVERQRQRLEQNLSAQFYDITAWSLPYAFNVDTWVAPAPPTGLRSLPELAGGIQGGGQNELGYVIPPQGIATYRVAVELQKRRIAHRVAMGSVGSELPAGTIFVPRRGNPADIRESLNKLLSENGLAARPVSSSFDMKGISLGSNDVESVKPIRAGLVSGNGVDATSFGFLWHLLDQQVGIPHDRLDLAQLAQVDLSELDVLVLPSGAYEDAITPRAREAVDAWIKAGGLLVAIGDSIEWLQKHEMTSVKTWEPPKKDGSNENEDPEGSGQTEVEKSLESRPIFTPGAILATKMQPNHPLTLGLRTSPKVLYEGTVVFKTTGDPRKDVLVAEQDPVVAGFAWPEAEERLSGSLLVGMETRGRGGVVLFAQDPAFRLFWRATTPILLNAILYGPSTGVGGRY
ncbi:MAG TPA: M14 family zinc carboxypeptidase, partial [Thermoanaerobaculia bacterium]|nr:M14 family zinc carboxypeptidase [Thermoanaerobaculia bacterium]